MLPKYVVITPARDEADYLERTIRSMAAQTWRPAQWVIVNDGSTDRTGEIVEFWAAQEAWIRPLHSDWSKNIRFSHRGTRALQAKEIEAFYRGYDTIINTDWAFLVKLDADLELPPDYFQRMFEEFERDPQLGLGGGVVRSRVNNRWTAELHPTFHVRGATKIYRRECWDAIGGVECGAGWDTLDEVHANMLGWKTKSFDHIWLNHLRPTGAANGVWRNAFKNGLWNYVSGYHPAFMILKCLRRVFVKPYFIDSIGLLSGYSMGYMKGIDQVSNTALIRYLRDQQLRKISFRSTIWK